MKLTAARISLGQVALGAIAFCAVGTAATPATAATFTFQKTDIDTIGGLGKRAGIHKSATATFNDQTNWLTWSSTIERNLRHNSLAEGAWLVLSEGPNPSEDVDEYAIFYLDGTQQRVSAYQYDGSLGKESWQSTQFLGAAALSVTDNGDERTFSFEMDTSGINGMTDMFGTNWKGAAFGEEIGVWLHSVDRLKTDYTATGELSKFDYKYASWFDSGVPMATVQSASAGEDAQDIPEPGSAIALGMFAGMVGLGCRGRKRAAMA